VYEDKKEGDTKKYTKNEEVVNKYRYQDENTSPIQLIGQLKGYYYINPIMALSLCITLFSFVGVPPLIGFFGKQMILSAALDNGYIFMSLVAILTSVISASYYIKIIRVIHTEETNAKPNTTESNELVLNNFHSFLISSLTLGILLFLIKPTIILNSVQLLSILLFDKYNIS
jgi:NADH-ubiquinone oxidoreductase chain 2